MKNIIGLMVILLPILSAAQSPPIKPLTIGDTVPDIIITNVYNNPASTIHLSDLKGKLVILDFWSTWCASCIASFPKMEKLQKDFSDQVQVIFVNSYEGDTIPTVANFFRRYENATGFKLKLPYALLQRHVQNYFPHNSIPHLVWIGKDGVVAAITSSDEAIAENVDKVLAGSKALHLKKDAMGYDYTKPLFTNGNTNLPDTFLYRSILTPYIEGVGSKTGIIKNHEGKVTMLYKFNSPAIGLVRIAFSDNQNINADRVILEMRDTSQFSKHLANGTGRYKNSYCYQITLPPSTIPEVLSYMREEMKKIFRIQVTNEKRKTKCLVLLPGNNIKKLKTKGGVQGFSSRNQKEQFTNAPVEEIVTWLTERLSIPVLNETGMKENIDISFPSSFDFTNKALLTRELTRRGFKVIETEQEFEYAVIRDLN